MSKYEILTICNGSLTEAEASKANEALVAPLAKCNSFKVKSLGLKTLAYKIEGCEKGYYFQMNFECDQPALVHEFDRQARLSKQCIRHLVVNLDKDYGANAIKNPKKVQRSEKQAKLYKEWNAKIQSEKEQAEQINAVVQNQEDAVAEAKK